ncbi:hypothetical protein E2C01_038517 [Portunus trituberculatus]|uniref:Uncharacterized protein n=1 Tax=Portunus trituberculatus TaxID=210409 RepID=A0A5B7FH11_PORTR|nr:hypothetical protein [Portunus trituberculatus]
MDGMGSLLCYRMQYVVCSRRYIKSWDVVAVECYNKCGDLSCTAIHVNYCHISAGEGSEVRKAECCLGEHPNELATSKCLLTVGSHRITERVDLAIVK